MTVRSAPILALALAATATPGCLAWRTHLEPGVREFPASVRAAAPAPLRLQIEAFVPATDEDARPVLDASPEDTLQLAALIQEANLVDAVSAHLAFADGSLRVAVRERSLGARWHAWLAVCTVGLVPYWGAHTIEAEAELRDRDGTLIERWTSRAEAMAVGHLLLLAPWTPDVLPGLRADALRGVVVRLAAELPRLAR